MKHVPKAVQKERPARKQAAIAIVEQQRSPINLVAADIWFDDPELAGLAVVTIRGDSMRTTFRSGDFALVDIRQNQADDGIFAVLEYNKGLAIYQIERVYESGRSTRRIRCTPRNPAYTPFELTLGEEAKIIGRVVQKITRHL
jgi:phage repressor protein C with HTH and peptisase S24 domain